MEDVKSVGWNSGYKMPKSKQWFHFAYTYNYASGNKVQQYFINGQPAVSTNSPGYPLFLFLLLFLFFSFTNTVNKVLEPTDVLWLVNLLYPHDKSACLILHSTIQRLPLELGLITTTRTMAQLMRFVCGVQYDQTLTLQTIITSSWMAMNRTLLVLKKKKTQKKQTSINIYLQPTMTLMIATAIVTMVTPLLISPYM